MALTVGGQIPRRLEGGTLALVIGQHCDARLKLGPRFLSRVRCQRRASEVAYLSHYATMVIVVVVVVIVLDQQEEDSCAFEVSSNITHTHTQRLAHRTSCSSARLRR